MQLLSKYCMHFIECVYMSVSDANKLIYAVNCLSHLVLMLCYLCFSHVTNVFRKLPPHILYSVILFVKPRLKLYTKCIHASSVSKRMERLDIEAMNSP